MLYVKLEINRRVKLSYIITLTTPCWETRPPLNKRWREEGGTGEARQVSLLGSNRGCSVTNRGI